MKTCCPSDFQGEVTFMSAVFVGIDVCKAYLDCALRRNGVKEGVARRFANSCEGREELRSFLAHHQVSLVILEATGGWEQEMVALLIESQVPVAVVNPRQVRDFAKALGQLAKTDAIDAAILAHFGEALRPPACFVGEEDTRFLKELMTRRRQLLEMIKAESHRLATASSLVRPNIEQSLINLKALLAQTDDDLGTFIQNSAICREKEQLLRSVPGVGRGLHPFGGVTRIGSFNR
jgi:transposase